MDSYLHGCKSTIIIIIKIVAFDSGFKISSCGNEPRTLSSRAYTTLTSCWFLYRYSFVLKRLDLVTRMKMVLQDPDIFLQFFFSKYTTKKKTVHKSKKKTCQQNPKTVSRRSAKKNSQLSETKFLIKRSKTNNEVSLPARESMKRPLTTFFPLTRRPSHRNTRLSERRASIKFINIIIY